MQYRIPEESIKEIESQHSLLQQSDNCSDIISLMSMCGMCLSLYGYSSNTINKLWRHVWIMPSTGLHAPSSFGLNVQRLQLYFNSILSLLTRFYKFCIISMCMLSQVFTETVTYIRTPESLWATGLRAFGCIYWQIQCSHDISYRLTS